MSGKSKTTGIVVGSLAGLLIGIGAGVGIGYGIWGSSEKISTASLSSDRSIEMHTAANEALDDWEAMWSIPVLSEVGTDEFIAEVTAKTTSVLGLVSDSIVFRDVPYALSDELLYDSRPIKTVQDGVGSFLGTENLGVFLYHTFSRSPNLQMQVFSRSIAIDETDNNNPTVIATTSWYLSNPTFLFQGTETGTINVTVTSRIEFDPSSFLVSSVLDTWDNSQHCPPANSITGVCA